MIETVFVVALLLIWMAVLSWLVLALAGAAFARSAARRAHLPEPETWPGVSLVIPAHNEQDVIEQSLRSFLALDYPLDRLQLLVVDDASTDATGAICDRIAATDRRLEVVHVPAGIGGTGKAAALNRALPRCRHPLIAVYDADTLPRRDAIRRLVGALSDGSHVAAVGRLLKVNSRSSLLRRLAALEFTTFQWTFQAGRSRLFDVVLLTGTNYVIRTDVVRDLGGWDPAALTEDLELSVRLYCRGHRVTFAPDAVAQEQDPDSLHVWIRQRTRWLIGNYYVLFRRTGAMVRSGHARALVVLWELYWLYALFLLALLASEAIFIGGLVGALHVPVEGRFLVLWALAFLVFLGTVQLAAALDRVDDWRTPLVGTAMYFFYSLLWLYVFARALVIYLARRGKVQWSKTPHTAS
ncbi:MAG TPA: glycosyltransferase [Gaiellaceae bacterium]|nr:glycosyltransferase [Gaiellaceae bacterium]